MSLNDTPMANRLHIGIFGRTNSGKSSLINALTGQQVSVVSPIEGTTTDPVYKSMEIKGIGPCVFIDTAGFNEEGELGVLRTKATRDALQKTDIALYVLGEPPVTEDYTWLKTINKRKIPVIPVFNKSDLSWITPTLMQELEKICGFEPVTVSAQTGKGIAELRSALLRVLPSDYEADSITGSLAKPGDVVLLVMPQDIQAPKGRLILPQVQTLRELLDKKCRVLCTTTDLLDEALDALKCPPALIITDSQVFRTVYEKKPKESALTSFSVLFAAYKGDISYFRESANAIGHLKPNAHVLIAEACTHAPLTEDIGREKIPRMLHKQYGKDIKVTVVSGKDFPQDLTPYDLIIHCGACMFNRRYVLSRVEQAKAADIPMTNYGIAIAYLQGILDQIEIPETKNL